ncbi:MAG: amidohydrolase family protein [Firmicutes bacterium]|nr:amidohydrolase family protein [Bacillota bacterium]
MILLKNCDLISMGPLGHGKYDVLIEGSKIKDIAPQIDAAGDVRLIDCEGKVVTPGLVEAHCHLGGVSDGSGHINEITGPIQLGLRACDAIDLDSDDFKRALRHGVTSMAVCPGSSNLIGGTYMTVKSAGDSREIRIIRAENGYKMALGENPKMNYSKRNQSPATRMGATALMREQFFKVKNYREKYMAHEAGEDNGWKYDFGLHSLMMIFDGTVTKIHAHSAEDILAAIRMAKEFGLTISVDHCTAGWQIVDDLKEAGFRYIFGPSLGGKSKNELADKSLDTPAIMEKAGIRFAITTDSGVIPMEGMLTQVAVHVKHGLSRPKAMKSVTIDAAWCVDIDDRVGSVEIGKDADIVIWNMHPLETMAKAETVIIDGVVRLENGEVL